MPLAYLDPEYPSWLAKRQMLGQCDLGDVLVVGDSRAAVNIVPALLDVKTTNLAVGGGQAIEAGVRSCHRVEVPMSRAARPPPAEATSGKLSLQIGPNASFRKATLRATASASVRGSKVWPWFS